MFLLDALKAMILAKLFTERLAYLCNHTVADPGGRGGHVSKDVRNNTLQMKLMTRSR